MLEVPGEVPGESVRKVVDVNACPIFQTADTAASESEMADYSVVMTFAVTPDRELLVLDMQRQRFEDTRVGAFVTDTYEGAVEHPPAARIITAKRPVQIVVENASSGPKVIRELADQGYPVVSASADLDKVTRALLAVARYEQGKVFHLRGGPWLRDFEEEICAFPAGTHDDAADALAYGAIWLPKIGLDKLRKKPKATPKTGGVRSKRF